MYIFGSNNFNWYEYFCKHSLILRCENREDFKILHQVNIAKTHTEIIFLWPNVCSGCRSSDMET